MKRLQRIAVIGLLFFLFSSGAVLAAAQGNALEVRIVSDQSIYEEDDVAGLTVSVKNISNKTVRNLRLTHILPDGLEYAYGSENAFRHSVIQPGETINRKIYVRKADQTVQIRVYADKKDTEKMKRQR